MELKPRTTQGSIREALVQAGMTQEAAGVAVSALIRTARPIAFAADALTGAEYSGAPVSRWLKGDYPHRINLILEQLGYEVRL
jgi:hypothetical protein